MMARGIWVLPPTWATQMESLVHGPDLAQPGLLRESGESPSGWRISRSLSAFQTDKVFKRPESCGAVAPWLRDPGTPLQSLSALHPASC